MMRKRVRFVAFYSNELVALWQYVGRKRKKNMESSKTSLMNRWILLRKHLETRFQNNMKVKIRAIKKTLRILRKFPTNERFRKNATLNF